VDYNHPAWFQDRREDFLMPWWDMARKIDSLGSAGVFWTKSGLKLSQDEVQACFFLYPFSIRVDYDHPAWFQDRREDFLMHWWDMAHKIDSLGSAGVFWMKSGLKLSQDEVRACFFLYPFTIRVDYNHPAWFQDRRGDFLIPLSD
jgi:hypothetical protein